MDSPPLPGSIRIGRREQESSNPACMQTIADDLPFVVDTARFLQFPSSAGRQQAVQIHHLAVEQEGIVEQEGMGGAVTQGGVPHDLAGIV